MIPNPPPPPPCRSYTTTLWRGWHETKESKQRSIDYKIFMEGWRAGFNSKNPKLKVDKPIDT